MASNKNNTRKRNRNKKTYRKRNRKTYRKMRGGNIFSSLTSNLKNSFSMFGTKAKEQATNTLNDTKAGAQAKIAQAQGFVTKKSECLATCAKL